MDELLGRMEAAFDRPDCGFLACTQVFWDKVIRIQEPRAKLLVNGEAVAAGQAEEAFVILNPEGKEVMVWSLDGCHLRGDASTQRCDAVFFNLDVLAFLELKLNATSTRLASVERNRAEAMAQLAAGWTYFKGKYGEGQAVADFAEIIAIRCVPASYPRMSAKGIAELSRFTQLHGIAFLEAQSFTVG